MRSLRGRLLVAVIGVTLLVYVVSAIGLYEYLVFKEEANLIDDLSQQWELVSGLIEEEDDGQRLELELDQLTTGKFVELYSGRYYVVQVEGQAPILSLSLGGTPPDFVSHLNSQELFEAVGPHQENLLVLSRKYHFARREIWVTVAESREELKRWLKDIRLALMMGLPFLLVILSLLLWLIIHSAFKPLGKLIADLDAFDFYQQAELTGLPARPVLEIDRLSKAFNKLLQRFQKIREAEEQLLIDVSHQLKTPLTVILSTCDVILQRQRESERYQQALQQIQETGRGMRTLINRLLSAAHLSSEKRQMEHFAPCDLTAIAQASVSKTQFLAQQKTIVLKCLDYRPVLVDGDSDRLEELILILIENAVVYSPPQTEITIRTMVRGLTAVLRVEDQGPGIPPEEATLIFQRFYRGKQSEDKTGTGLGLALAEQIVHVHKGRIHVVANAEGGSCFECVFPLRTDALKP